MKVISFFGIALIVSTPALARHGKIEAEVEHSGNSAIRNSGNSSASGGAASSTVQLRERRIPVSTAYAPALSSGFDSCEGSTSAGLVTRAVGISLGGTRRDKTCELIKLGREAAQMGMPDVQCQLLALDVRFNEALRRSGRSCALPVRR
jgi:hypothetical protein